DNGDGIRPDAIDVAMTVGGRRDYTDTDLGRFGLGLKAASFSQAASLTVLSKAVDVEPVGRRWLLQGNRAGFHCDRVLPEFAAAELRRNWPMSLASSGTVVRWDDVNGFPAFDDPEHTEEFLSRTISHLQGHLGLMFHRILSREQVRISIDVEDIDAGLG